jgi:hypothetical protein
VRCEHYYGTCALQVAIIIIIIIIIIKSSQVKSISSYSRDRKTRLLQALNNRVEGKSKEVRTW